MKVVFVCNILSHHQQDFCENMLKLCDFNFVATSNESCGYQKSIEADYVHHWYNDAEKDNIRKLIKEADVMIAGGCPQELLKIRANENKLTFHYSERFFKKGTWRRFIPTTRKKIKDSIVQYKDKNFYVLCASAYLPYDLSLMGFPTGKIYKWGYFPEIKQYDIDKLMEKKKEDNRINLLWCARFLDWKHPEKVLLIAKKLKQDNVSFKIRMIGNGECFDRIKKEICKYKLDDEVEMVGSIASNDVRDYMEKSDIFLFTSDYKEGWGAVLNESMNSGCAVVASHAIGSVPYLINDGVNGLIYKSEDNDDLYRKVKLLCDNFQLRDKLGRNAYQTISSEWSAEIAAQRLYTVVKQFMLGRDSNIYENGPCSRAAIIKNHWYKQ